MNHVPQRLSVFISYASEDRASAIALAGSLRSAGYEPWVDSERILPGADWKTEIIRAIETSHAFIALLSLRSISKRGFVQKEMKTAIDIVEQLPHGEVFVIPVRIEECQPSHPFLANVQWVDLFPTQDPGVSRIFASLEGLRAGKKAVETQNSEEASPLRRHHGKDLTIYNDFLPLEAVLIEIMDLWEGNVGAPGRNNKRIAEHAYHFATSLSLSEETLPFLRIGATARNIGMLAIPKDIITKSGRLDIEEFQLLREHTIFGEQILRAGKTSGFLTAAQIARSHHEKWDGTGYPDGLKGDAIPLEARIVAIVDTFYAMSENRPYRARLGKDLAVEYMRDMDGFFDPRLLSAFCDNEIYSSE